MNNLRLSLFVALFSLASCLSPKIRKNEGVALCAQVEIEMVYLPVEGDCTKYIECFNGEGTILSCPDGLWYDQKIEACDVPGPYCAQTPDSAIPAAADPRCADGGLHYFPDPESCSTYLQCFQGSIYLARCPVGFWYSASRELCVIDEESECCDVKPEC